jgi:hypothetical protein
MYHLSQLDGFNELVYNKEPKSTLLTATEITCRTKTNQKKYKVIKYDKWMLCLDQTSTYGLCRSVIVNDKNEVVCFSPPKSYNADQFIHKYKPNVDDIVAEEFIEGTMINVFYDKGVGWEIATRNIVGGTSTFYKSVNSKSFRQMFTESLETCKLDMNKLDQQLCYSFVMQHPANRIVIPFKTPNLYLVGVYKIHNEINNITVDFLDVRKYQDYFHTIGSSICFPKIYNFTNYAELIETYCSMNTSYDIMGVVLYNNTTGERAKIRNPVYEQIRQLKGNQPKLQFQYLYLRHSGKIKDYLEFYPEDKKEFSKFRDQVHLFTNTLYENYRNCYIKKLKPLNEYSLQYRNHMYQLHQIFLNELREKKLFINNTIVQNYVNKLEPSLLMYSLNFEMRKHLIHTNVAEANV